MSFSTITPPAVSSTAVAMTVWSYSPRSLTEIQSVNSAIQNNDPSAVLSYSDYTYLPVPYYAGQVTIDQLATFVDNAVRNYNLINVIASLVSNNPYGLWATNFVTNLSINPYLTVTSLTMLLSSPYLDGNHAQVILYSLAQNYYYNKWIQTITASYGSTTISTNVTITTSPIFAQSLTISSGVTVKCGLNTCYFITQQFNNYGTIVNQNGGVSGTANGGIGGTGGGGIVVLALTSALGTLNVNGSKGLVGATSSPGYNGSAGGNGTLLSIATIPSGGNGGGYAPSGGGGGGGPNGNGGSAYAVGGNGGSVTLYTFSNANSMLTFIMQGVSDWFTINVLGKSPSSTTPLYNINNAGGGSGGNNGENGVGGGGGGGGGEVIAYAYNFISGNISANGGIGGTGLFGLNNPSGGGGGGAGGLIYVFYGSTSGSLTFNVAGGAGGVSSNSSANGSPGSTGIATTIQVTVNG